jgi:hypothetical protein
VPVKITHNPKSGAWSFSYTRHLVSSLGFLFLGRGLAGLLSPWWWPLLFIALGVANVPLDVGINWWISITLTVIGLGVLAIKYFLLDPRNARWEQDKASITASPPNVSAVCTYFDILVEYHSFQSSLDLQFYESHEQFAKPATKFQDQSTDFLFQEYAKSARDLHYFVRINFFVYPSNQWLVADFRYCMTPRLNMDRDMPTYDADKAHQYNDLKQQLEQKVTAARKAYDAFIARLRKLGHI